MKTDFIIFFALILLYFRSIPDWITEWTNFDSFYSFFPFFILFTIHFFKIKSEKLKKIEIRPVNWGIFIFFIGLLIYFAGIRADMGLLNALSLLFLLCGMVLFFYGTNIFTFVLPVILLFSLSIPAIPIFRITVPLQIFLAETTVHILNILEINAYNLGSAIYFDKYLISIEAGCTGVRSLSSLLVVGFMLFYFRKISAIKKSLICVGILIIAFIANIARILVVNFYIIYNGMNEAESFHYWAGLVIFVLSLLVILIMDKLIKDDKINTVCTNQKMNFKFYNRAASEAGRPVYSKIIIIISIIVTFILANTGFQDKTTPNFSVAAGFPMNFDNWHGENIDIEKTNDIFTIIPPEQIVLREYKKANSDANSINLALILADDKKRIHDPQICYKLQGFEFFDRKEISLVPSLTANFIKARKKDQKYLFIYWYTDLDGNYTTRMDFWRGIFIKKILGKPIKSYGIAILYTQIENETNLKEFTLNVNNAIFKLL